MKRAIIKFIDVIFPQAPRDFACRRLIRMMLRSIHIACTGILLGAYIFRQPVSTLEFWLFLSVLTGLLIMLMDLHASAAVFFEVRGLAVLIKAGLLCAIPFYPRSAIPILIIALVIGVFASHMPKQYRHKMIFFEKYFLPDRRSG